MTHRRIILGSLTGALCIHLAMLACSGTATTIDTPSGDASTADARATLDSGGAAVDTGAPTADTGNPAADAGFLDALLDAVRDVIGEVVDAEVRDAHAGGDGGTPPADAGPVACACPTPPVPSASFAFTFDRGRGEERPDAEFSSAIMEVRTTRGTDAAPTRVVSASAQFYRGSEEGSLSCNVRVNAAFAVAEATSCSFSLGEGGAYSANATRGLIEGARVVTFEQERLELRYDSVRACRSGTSGPCVTLRNVVFRAYTPGARYRDIPSAYVP